MRWTGTASLRIKDGEARRAEGRRYHGAASDRRRDAGGDLGDGLAQRAA